MDKNSTDKTFNKTQIVIRDLSKNPPCLHGPSILFKRGQEEFFACSAFRSRKECSFYEKNSNGKIFSKPLTIRRDPLIGNCDYFCKTCNVPFKHICKDHNKDVVLLTNELKSCPTKLLNAVSNNKTQAQYFFAQKTISFFSGLIKNGKYKFLCIGTPSIFEEVINEDSYFLDIDPRFEYFYEPSKFSRYNMCNHYFFTGNESYKKFIKRGSKDLLIFIDPPFGVRFELLNSSCLQIANEYKGEVKIILISPYFMEGHIKNIFSEFNLVMSDYKIEYTNHRKFSVDSATKSRSAVRFFTNIPQASIVLDDNEYQFCDLCQRYIHKLNQHCKLCGTCPTKDGKTYVHCSKCKKCVKPTWTHCDITNICINPNKNEAKDLSANNYPNNRGTKRKKK